MFNEILEHLGFSLPKQWDDESVIMFPEAEYDLIKAVISLLDSLVGSYILLINYYQYFINTS